MEKKMQNIIKNGEHLLILVDNTPIISESSIFCCDFVDELFEYFLEESKKLFLDENISEQITDQFFFITKTTDSKDSKDLKDLTNESDFILEEISIEKSEILQQQFWKSSYILS